MGSQPHVTLAQALEVFRLSTETVMSGPAFSTIRSDNVTLIWFNRDTMAIAMLLRKLVRKKKSLINFLSGYLIMSGFRHRVVNRTSEEDNRTRVESCRVTRTQFDVSR
ncbi:hypothetical protein ACVIW2_000161 [Bradyrhizobium huanghuaihaiense]